MNRFDHQLKRALLIGIDNYCSNPLHGCVNDVLRVQDLLPKFGFSSENISVMINRAATRESILSALEGYVHSTRQDDVFLFWFSGHGSERINETKHNGWNETIVPFGADSVKDTTGHITDDEISSLL